MGDGPKPKNRKIHATCRAKTRTFQTSRGVLVQEFVRLRGDALVFIHWYNQIYESFKERFGDDVLPLKENYSLLDAELAPMTIFDGNLPPKEFEGNDDELLASIPFEPDDKLFDGKDLCVAIGGDDGHDDFPVSLPMLQQPVSMHPSDMDATQPAIDALLYGKAKLQANVPCEENEIQAVRSLTNFLVDLEPKEQAKVVKRHDTEACRKAMEVWARSDDLDTKRAGRYLSETIAYIKKDCVQMGYSI